MPRLIESVLLVVRLLKDPFQGVLLSEGQGDVGFQARESDGVGQGVDAPLTDADKEYASVEALPVARYQQIDFTEDAGVWREE